MHLIEKIRTKILGNLYRNFAKTINPELISIGPTRQEFEGDLTVVVFPLVKLLQQSPLDVGNAIGEHLINSMDEISSFNVVKGFLNLTVTNQFWKSFVEDIRRNPNFGNHPSNGEKVMIEFASPNTNKPLHLGHVRNILLGWSCSKILKAAGFDVVKVQVINDRGIAICKSMVAWQRFAQGATPESTGTKGDHFVGHYYVAFEKAFAEEYKLWQITDTSKLIYEEKAREDQGKLSFFKEFRNQYFNQYSELGLAARKMLQLWEEGDEDTMQLWNMMNQWVYDGFEATYDKLGVSFDKLYYESETWQLGKKEVLQGVEKNKFVKKGDGSIWVDLTGHGMDEKILLRSDGTSVYMTQDIGTALLRYRDFGIDRMVYVVGDEQNYHFKVLFQILDLLEQPFAEGLHHLSYGMVDLPSGKMKTREGTIVDADELIVEVIEKAQAIAKEKGELSHLPIDEQESIFNKIGMGALKFFILKVNPQKRMLFDPAASVDLQGQTGPYVQNAYVRIQSLLRKAEEIGSATQYMQLSRMERVLSNQLLHYGNVVKRAAADYDPSLVANYAYDLAKSFHRFYHEEPILHAEEAGATNFRLQMSQAVAKVLQHSMDLLGIHMPEKM